MLTTEERNRMKMKRAARRMIIKVCEENQITIPDFGSVVSLMKAKSKLKNSDEETFEKCVKVLRTVSKDGISDKEFSKIILGCINEGSVKYVYKILREFYPNCKPGWDTQKVFAKAGVLQAVKEARADSRKYLICNEDYRAIKQITRDEAIEKFSLSYDMFMRRVAERIPVAEKRFLISLYDYKILKGEFYA